MPQIKESTKEKVRDYVKDSVDPRKSWESNADSIVHLLENGKIISEKDIMYDDDGNVVKIKGTQVVDGVLLLKEKKQPLKTVVEPTSGTIPFIEDLRSRRKVITL
jgi:hypothetical protein